MAAVNPSANMVVLHVRSPMNAFCFPFFFQEERLAGFMPRRGYAVCMVHGEVVASLSLSLAPRRHAWPDTHRWPLSLRRNTVVVRSSRV
jgi:hypothetical protein